MKRSWKDKLILVMLLFAAGCATRTADDTIRYTCPMHPTVIAEAPGQCPVCGMDLVPQTRPDDEIKITPELARLLKSPNEAVLATVKTIRPQYKSVPVSARATGVVTYDPRKIYTIPSRVAGRVEKVYLRYEFQPVRKGQKVAEIYSPELVTAQRELLYLLEHDPENEGLIQASARRLRLLGATDSQIDDLIKRRSVSRTFSIHSSYNGFVIGSDLRSELTPRRLPSREPDLDSESTGKALVREGDYVSEGETLFRIANTDALRVTLDILDTSVPMIHAGDTVELDLGNGVRSISTVNLVQPFFSEGKNFIKVRVHPRNPGNLVAGQLVEATIALGARESLWLPRESIIDLGTESVVFLKKNDMLKPEKVITGVSVDNLVEIKSGLATGDEVAANAQYLTGSESFIKP